MMCRVKQSCGSKSTQNSAVSSSRSVADDMTVPKTLLDEKLQELLVKDETIQVGPWWNDHNFISVIVPALWNTQ